MYYYISTNAYDYVATPDYCKPHGYKIRTVFEDGLDPVDYVMLTPREKRRMSYYSLDMLDDIKRDKFNWDEEARDRAAELFIYDQFVRDPLNVWWEEVDGDLQELLDSAEWYITVQA